MITKIKSKREFSAGGVVYRQLKTKNKKLKIEWLICKHSGYHKWVLPKGLVEKGESLEETALREVEEECGVKAKIIAKLKEPESYVYTMEGVRIFKRVDYFLMEYVSGKIKDHSWEMEAVAWLEFDQAYERLSFPGAKQALKNAQKILKEQKRQSR
jgi:8-oxo-dGTP pyrophosphatase MutT (NUDIX family)